MEHFRKRAVDLTGQRVSVGERVIIAVLMNSGEYFVLSVSESFFALNSLL